MLRYVILRHEMPSTASRPSHWDLMLEQNGVLQTWALEVEPCAGREIRAEQLPEHRLAYLDYEGPVSGDRGEVRRWDAGTWTPLRESADLWEGVLRGERLRGNLSLSRDPAATHRWMVKISIGE